MTAKVPSLQYSTEDKGKKVKRDWRDIALLFFLPFYSFTFLPLKNFVLPIYFILRIFAPEKIKNEYV